MYHRRHVALLEVACALEEREARVGEEDLLEEGQQVGAAQLVPAAGERSEQPRVAVGASEEGAEEVEQRARGDGSGERAEELAGGRRAVGLQVGPQRANEKDGQAAAGQQRQERGELRRRDLRSVE